MLVVVNEPSLDIQPPSNQKYTNRPQKVYQHVHESVCACGSSCYRHLIMCQKMTNENMTSLISLLQKQGEVSQSNYVNLLCLVQFVALILAQKTQILLYSSHHLNFL